MNEYIKILEKAINEKLRNIKIKVCRRYDYYAIDMEAVLGETIMGTMGTIQTSMSRKELIQTLEAIKRVLWYEETKQ